MYRADGRVRTTAVSIPKEQVKDGEVFHLLSQKAVDIVRQKVGGEKVRNVQDCVQCSPL